MTCFKVLDGTFYRGNRLIFEKMTFEVLHGEILAVLGCNGVGKTTLIQCCMGLLQWTSGKSYLENRSVSHMSNKELFSKIAYIPQAKNLNIGLSVLDMVLLGCNPSVRVCPKKEHIERAKEILDKMGIFHLHNQPCDCLSGGELQMVIFARALVKRPLLSLMNPNQISILKIVIAFYRRCIVSRSRVKGLLSIRIIHKMHKSLQIRC